jgi:GWxTD domain-containing protein
MPEIRPEDLGKLDIANTFVMQFTDQAQLKEHVNSLHPITSNVERNTIEYQLKEADLTLLRQFFYSFWERRNPENPEEAWNKYLLEVQKVQANYATRIKKGYETDRGRVYLQYGPPNTQVVRHNDTDAYPYEIWHYYQAGRFRNKRFVFYNPDLVSNDFELLQSDVPGEIKNDRWVMMILQRNNSMANQEQRTIDNGASRVLIDLYNNPR